MHSATLLHLLPRGASSAPRASAVAEAFLARPRTTRSSFLFQDTLPFVLHPFLPIPPTSSLLRLHGTFSFAVFAVPPFPLHPVMRSTDSSLARSSWVQMMQMFLGVPSVLPRCGRFEDLEHVFSRVRRWLLSFPSSVLFSVPCFPFTLIHPFSVPSPWRRTLSPGGIFSLHLHAHALA